MTDKQCTEGIFFLGSVRAIHWSYTSCCAGDRRKLETDTIADVTCKHCLRRYTEPKKPTVRLPDGVRATKQLRRYLGSMAGDVLGE